MSSKNRVRLPTVIINPKEFGVKKKMLALPYCRIMNLLHTALNAVIYDLDALTGAGRSVLM